MFFRVVPWLSADSGQGEVVAFEGECFWVVTTPSMVMPGRFTVVPPNPTMRNHCYVPIAHIWVPVEQQATWFMSSREPPLKLHSPEAWGYVSECVTKALTFMGRVWRATKAGSEESVLDLVEALVEKPDGEQALTREGEAAYAKLYPCEFIPKDPKDGELARLASEIVAHGMRTGTEFDGYLVDEIPEDMGAAEDACPCGGPAGHVRYGPFCRA